MSQLNIDLLRLNMKQQNANTYLTVFGNDNYAAGGFYYNGTAGLWTTSLDNTSGYNYQAPVVLGANGVPIDGGSGTNPVKEILGSVALTTPAGGGGVSSVVTLTGNAIFTNSYKLYVSCGTQFDAASTVVGIVGTASTFTVRFWTSYTTATSVTVYYRAIGY
jgi:hypothetical protein